ncbi:uncharacterized protein LOC131605475 [Vicia villosa]|uniref:uncharacterized protein LOC131605475 n=1 Tax=Vicia villosa TaxID=3911 RepID=UPI00273C297B|nr:uncharacterized protein LOC131605475 [Vicia villosa]
MRRLEVKLQKELRSILNQEELMWYYSRARWLVDGDRNTKYYHMQTISRRKRNRINMLRDDNGNWITKHEELKDHVTKFYKALFARNNNWCNWKQTDINFLELSMDAIHQLGKDISIDEVKSALFSMKLWKEPEPDGFPVGFYQKAWDVVGVDLSKFVKETWQNPSSITDINRADICLIPKVDQP